MKALSYLPIAVVAVLCSITLGWKGLIGFAAGGLAVLFGDLLDILLEGRQQS